jgi:hypothetical protein
MKLPSAYLSDENLIIIKSAHCQPHCAASSDLIGKSRRLSHSCLAIGRSVIGFFGHNTISCRRGGVSDIRGMPHLLRDARCSADSQLIEIFG